MAQVRDVFATEKIYWYYGAVLNLINESGSAGLSWINCNVSKATKTKVNKNEILDKIQRRKTSVELYFTESV